MELYQGYLVIRYNYRNDLEIYIGTFSTLKLAVEELGILQAKIYGLQESGTREVIKRVDVIELDKPIDNKSILQILAIDIDDPEELEAFLNSFDDPDTSEKLLPHEIVLRQQGEWK